jgi:hypothetical protein
MHQAALFCTSGELLLCIVSQVHRSTAWGRGEAQPSKQIRDLAASRWIANGENVLLLGPPESDSYCSSRYVLKVPVLSAADRQMPDGANGALARPV